MEFGIEEKQKKNLSLRKKYQNKAIYFFAKQNFEISFKQHF